MAEKQRLIYIYEDLYKDLPPEHKYTRTAQGPAVRADAEATTKDDLRLTHPNLHRRVEENPTVPDTYDEEGNLICNAMHTPDGHKIHSIKNRISVYGNNSYRLTEYELHDEDSQDCEIP